MKITVVMAMAAVGMSASALEVGESAPPTVIVYVNSDEAFPSPLSLAERMAAQMFAEVDVRIEWRIGRPAAYQLLREQAIAIQLATHTPEDLHPGALAFAHPYQGIHLTVFWDRLQEATEPGLTPMLLAHVLVHEITHILQGVAHHSNSGVMKGSWTDKDYADMRRKPLPFATEDIRLLRLGLDGRGSLLASSKIAAR